MPRLSSLPRYQFAISCHRTIPGQQIAVCMCRLDAEDSRGRYILFQNLWRIGWLESSCQGPYLLVKFLDHKKGMNSVLYLYSDNLRSILGLSLQKDTKQAH